MKPSLVRASVVTSLALLPLGLAAGPAQADPQAPTTIDFQCQAKPPIGEAQTFTMALGVSGAAPSAASVGDAVAITLTPAAQQVPGSVSGHALRSLRGFKLFMPVPTNSTYVSSTVSGGTVAATVGQSGGRLTLDAPGTAAAGSDFTLPAVTVNVTASAAGTITSTLAGTSFDDPGLTFTASVDSGTILGAVDVPVKCYPGSAPTLTHTTVSAGNPGGNPGGTPGSNSGSGNSNSGSSRLPGLAALTGSAGS
ncbi:hypothetical protein ACFYTS_34820 [Nocardia sp. NPDC004151]|uniref:hypothetical protein n=1 Tax=Nocardia sp. NPDC004151 TaxID=3364304 RepID=UPI0036C6B134